MPPRQRDRVCLPALLVCVLIECLWVASFSPFPTVDSAGHLGSTAAVLQSLHASPTHVGHANHALEWRFAPPPPNLLPSLLLAVAAEGFGYERADALVIMAYTLCFALALYWSVRRLRPGAEALAFFALPYTFSLPLLFGFLNFSWSLVFVIVFWGYVLHERFTLDRRGLLLTAAGLLLLYATHLAGWLLGSIVLGCVVLARALHAPARRVQLLSRGLLALAPTVLLAGWFSVASGSSGAKWSAHALTKALRIALLEYGMSMYDRREAIVYAALAIPFWLLVWRSRAGDPARPRRLALLLAMGLTLLIAALGPEGASSGAVALPPRLAAGFALLGVLLVADGGLIPREGRLVAGACVAAALAVAWLREPELRAIELQQRAILRLAPHVREHSTLVQANVAVPQLGDMKRADPLTAEVGRLAAASGALDLGNCDLALPYFPLRFREQQNPYRWLVPDGAEIEHSPPPLQIGAFEQHTGLRVDYIVLAGRAQADAALLDSPEWQRFDAQLQAGFQHVAGTELWQLWEAKPHALAAAVPAP